MCVSCAGRHGDGCWTCDETTCRDCGEERVLENGRCRVGDQCTKSDGMSFVECADGFILINATDCALKDECARTRTVGVSSVLESTLHPSTGRAKSRSTASTGTRTGASGVSRGLPLRQQVPAVRRELCHMRG